MLEIEDYQDVAFLVGQVVSVGVAPDGISTFDPCVLDAVPGMGATLEKITGPPVGIQYAVQREKTAMPFKEKQQLTPKLIQVCSTPDKHSVILDGQTVFTGKTEIDCASYLVKSICNWPAAYQSTCLE